MGVYGAVKSPMGQTKIDMKVNGRLYDAILCRISRLHMHDPEYGLHLPYSFVLSPEEAGEVADRLFEECNQVDVSKFEYHQEYWRLITDFRTAYALTAASKRGESIGFG